MAYAINDAEFKRFSSLLYDIAGIVLTDAKKILLTGRLTKRLIALGLDNFTQYFKYVTDGAHPEELQYMVDLLTTNETYFFREPQHFDFLKQVVPSALRQGQVYRVWSAAASNGAEAYTIAMILADKLGVDGAWEIFGTDINNSILEQARSGHYRMAETEKIPREYLKRYCLKGKGPQEGTFMIGRNLRQHVRFEQMNLNVEQLKKVGDFDVIFLRNVLIYFDVPTKQRVVANLIPCMRNGGYFIVGHAESLNGITDVLKPEQPTIYRRL
jgi:chemotaxis protein methyltransferase CheR